MLNSYLFIVVAIGLKFGPDHLNEPNFNPAFATLTNISSLDIFQQITFAMILNEFLGVINNLHSNYKAKEV